jgi:menaquinol-cytochrome c reductase iron-sulfur subunit
MGRNFLYLAAEVVFIFLTSVALSSSVRAQSDADKLFKTHCALCHAADGSGNAPTGKALHAKDLRSAEVQNQSDADLTTIISMGKGKMPAFNKKLKPEDIKALVAYVRGLGKK